MSKGLVIFETFVFEECVGSYGFLCDSTRRLLLRCDRRMFFHIHRIAGFYSRIARAATELQNQRNRQKHFQKILLSVGKNDFPPDNFVISPGNLFQRLNIKRVLVFQNFRRESFRRVRVGNFNRPLREYRAVVEIVVNKMNRAAGYFNAVFNRLPLRVESGKRGQQARMNINDFIRERLNKMRRQKPHITRQTNQLDPARV